MIVGKYGRALPGCGDLLRLRGRTSCLFVRRDMPRWALVNKLGEEVLELCDGRRSLHEIACVIGKDYDRSFAEVKKDVVSFWSELESSRFFSGASSEWDEPTEVKLGAPQVYVTTRCNQPCAHCSVRGAFPEGDMPADLFREVVRQSVALGAGRIVVTGGEPFLREDLIDLLRSTEGTVPVQVLTNGTLIDAATACELARLQVAVQASLDGGCREVHDSIRGEGAFAAALRGIRLLRDSSVECLTINFTIQRANANDVPNFLELLEREGITQVWLMLVVPGVEGERKFQCADADSILTVTQYLDEYRGPVATGLRVPGFGADALSGRRWCSPGQSPSIGPDGSVFPCLPFTRTPFLMGRMPKDTLEQAFHSKVVQDLRRKCQERIDEIEECSSCVWKHFCRAGCPGIAYHQHGSVTAKDCFCELRKRLYTDLFLGGQDNGDRRPE